MRPTLLRAMEELPGYSVTIAGQPDDAEYFAAEILPRVKNLRAAGREVDLRDQFVADEEVGKLFMTHSAIVLPYTKGFVAQSGVAFMALAYDLPMVASEAGGLRDLLGQFKVGVTFEDYTPAGLATAVRSLCEGSENLAAQIRAAREYYSWDVAAMETVAGYRAALWGRREQDAVSLSTTAVH